MRRVLNKYVFLVTCLFVGLVVFAQTQPQPPYGYPDGVPPPSGLTCCGPLEAEPGEPGYSEYQDCITYYTANPNAPCQTTIPIDNSIYIYISMVAAVALASFVIARRMKT